MCLFRALTCICVCVRRLRLKQARYPVLFLTVNDCPQWNVPVDMRSRRIEDALMHAEAQGLQVT